MGLGTAVRTRTKLGQVFDPRANALNAFRLVLAAEVILWHSFPVTGHSVSSRPVLQLLFSVGVDGFFALSGFLITSSWLRNPQLRDYLVARALRILPGLYACLIVTAFVFAPLSLAIQGGSATRLLLSSAPIEYVLKNSTLLSALQLDIGGTPLKIPDAGVWNASVWTLMWEVLCYLAVAAIGVVGLANRRWLTPAILALAMLGATLLPPLTFPGEWTNLQLAARFAIMFSAGALLYQWRDVIPARWSLVAVSVLIVAASSLLPDYRVIGGLPLAYAIIVSGSLIHNKRLRLRTDLSYGTYIYASPIQQLLAVCGLSGLNPLLFFVIATTATLPLAALSWVLIEKPAQSLKSRLKRIGLAPSFPKPADPDVTAVAGERPQQHGQHFGSHADRRVRRRVPTTLGKAEEPGGSGQGERDQRAAG
jgi:peptidoglycan/LPS O-acetylase OafA/YrhL